MAYLGRLGYMVLGLFQVRVSGVDLNHIAFQGSTLGVLEKELVALESKVSGAEKVVLSYGCRV